MPFYDVRSYSHHSADGMVAPRLCGRYHSRRQRSIFFRHARGRGRRRHRRPRATPPAACGRLFILLHLPGLAESKRGAAAAWRRARVAARQRLAAPGMGVFFFGNGVRGEREAAELNEIEGAHQN